MKKRTIFIGDLQGCFHEFLNLLDKTKYDPVFDELILLGDMINRGPKNLEVMTFLLENPQVKAVMGNHEYHFLRHLNKTRRRKSFKTLEVELKPIQKKVKSYISTLPMYIETPEWIAVHAGLEPGIHPSKTKAKFLCTVRDVGANGESRPWYDFYFDEKWVVFGHWSLKGLVVKKKVRGLDTGCVYGGALTAWIFPDDQLVSVKAKEMYFDPFKD